MTEQNQNNNISFNIEDITDIQIETISGGVLPGGCYRPCPDIPKPGLTIDLDKFIDKLRNRPICPPYMPIKFNLYGNK